MILKKWEDLPECMQRPQIRPYYDKLNKRKTGILIKRVLDFVFALILLAICAVPMAVIALLISLDSKGPVFYRQERITRYGKKFMIHKFRTMVKDADKIGPALTSENDSRITGLGKKLRRLKLDELPQLLDVISGNMSLVGTRPEAPKYVSMYKPEYMATLLLPAGITSEASIRYINEEQMLTESDDPDKTYIETILPAKMEMNLKGLETFNIFKDFLIVLKTAAALIGGKSE